MSTSPKMKRPVGLKLAVMSLLLITPSGAQTPAELHVDVSSGSDSNPGTASLPVQTISRAVQLTLVNARNGIPATVIIHPGTYRESLDLDFSKQSINVPIVFRALQGASPIISGADVWTDWAPDSRPGVYTHAWPYRWGLCPKPSGWPALSQILRRREMVMVNGSLLKQVLSAGALAEGTFYVDESHGMVYAFARGGADLRSANVEVSVRPTVLNVGGANNFTLQGLTFQYGNTCISQSAADVHDSTNVLIEDSTFLWNNWEGLGLSTDTGVTVRRVVANYNGAVGVGGYQLSDAVLENIDASYNNWRGLWGDFLDWDPSGAKFLLLRRTSVRGFRAVGNDARGLWFDTDNTNVNVDGAFLSGNRGDGLFIEANQGPISVANSRICANGGGVLTGNSANVTLSGNLISYNSGAQILISGDPGGRDIQDWETGQGMTLFSSAWTLSGNFVQGADAKQPVFETLLPMGDWNVYAQSLTSDNNTWYNASNAQVFWLPGGKVDLAGWQASTGQDPVSVFAPVPAAMANACQDTGSAGMTVSRSSLAFTYLTGSPVPAPQTFRLASIAAPLNYTATASTASGGNWLRVSPGSGVTPQDLTVSVDTSTLAPGSYTGAITIASSGSMTVPVTLSIGVGQTVSATPSDVPFSFQIGAVPPSPKLIQVSSSSGNVPFTAAASVISPAGGTWLKLNPTSGMTPSTLSVSVDPIGLPVGIYSGMVSITSPGAVNGALAINVVLSVVAVDSAPAPTSVVNAASFLPGPIAPGEILAIFGTNLGPATPVSFSVGANGLVSPTLADTGVTFDNIPGIVYVTSDKQINVIAPYALSGKQTTRLVVVYKGLASAPIDLRVMDAAPGVFAVGNSTQGAILNQDLSPNSVGNPAGKDSVIVLYATGEGQTAPAGQDGWIVPLDPSQWKKPLLPVSVLIGGQQAQVEYYGSAPLLVSGLMQINARVPAGTPSGNQPVSIKVGAVPSQTVTVAIQ